MSENTLWGIHAGRSGEAESQFLKNNVIALGWKEIGNLGHLENNRETFKDYFASKYPQDSRSRISACAGQLFRFVYEMRIGDLVAFPARSTRTIHLGRIISDYEYVSSQSNVYPQQRRVEWIKEVPRTHFSQGALYEIGSALSLFTVRTYKEEFQSALNAPINSEPIPPIDDETVSEVKHDVEESTSDFILKILAQKTKGHPFADFVGDLLRTMGYRTRISSPGADGGIDIVAHKDVLGFEPPIIKVQVKSSEKIIGDPVISQLYGKVTSSEFGLFVTLGTFTKQAIQFAQSKSNLVLINGESLIQLILEHYEQLDSKYKALIPLRRVYIPDRAGSDEE